MRAFLASSLLLTSAASARGQAEAKYEGVESQNPNVVLALDELDGVVITVGASWWSSG